ncbi:hypothetical protein GCM10009848_46430 [Micromonospora lupini]
MFGPGVSTSPNATSATPTNAAVPIMTFPPFVARAPNLGRPTPPAQDHATDGGLKLGHEGGNHLGGNGHRRAGADPCRARVAVRRRRVTVARGGAAG